ncbi:ribonuclease kappa-B isoform X1 [Kryptolebias marmoratus]|uniref:ribonuclease kappa-B isoform X1 n=1 Tax=Kryptolebias marmoratus TaxID=37003 RepID=UPI0018ACBF6F|nr:ribonuclease kappa-B isoform X1 [Kryptolebias marmoratus]
MPSLLFCGPKMAACGMVISIWGVIMLAMLGIFFSAKSAVLIEDVPFTEEDIRNEVHHSTRLVQADLKPVVSYILSRETLGGLSFRTTNYSDDVSTLTETSIKRENPPGKIYSLYNQVGINCFIAAGVYVVVGVVSLCQVRLNKRQEYMVT